MTTDTAAFPRFGINRRTSTHTERLPRAKPEDPRATAANALRPEGMKGNSDGQAKQRHEESFENYES